MQTRDITFNDILRSEMSEGCAHSKSLSARYNAEENMDRVCVQINEIFMLKYSELRRGESKKSSSADEKKAPKEQQQLENKKAVNMTEGIEYTELYLYWVEE